MEGDSRRLLSVGYPEEIILNSKVVIRHTETHFSPEEYNRDRTGLTTFPQFWFSKEK